MDRTPKNPDDEIAPPSAELVLIRVILSWYLNRLPRKERASALLELHEIMDRVLGLENVHSIRPASQDAAVRKARRRARNWWFAVFGPRE